MALLKLKRLTLDPPSSLRPWQARLFRAVRPMFERFFGVSRINAMIERAEIRVPQGATPIGVLNEITGIHPLISPQDLERIPRHGPLLVVSNHPYGVADPQAVATLLKSVRTDAKFVANRLLGLVPFVADDAFLVDVLGGPNSVATNASALFDACTWLREGGCLCMFPAGEVSHITWRSWRSADGPWTTTAARLAKRSGAAVLPIFVEGRNSVLFQLGGLIHPIIRTLMLPREFFRMSGRGLRIRVGTPLSPAQVARFSDHRELTRFLRVRCELLASRREVAPWTHPRPLAQHAVTPCERGESADRPTDLAVEHAVGAMPAFAGAAFVHEDEPLPPQPVPLVPQHSPEELAAEVATLEPEALLLRQGDYEIYCARSPQLPLLMLEMGRLRELAFRAVGEGSGRSLDIDRFDKHYRQLFVWNARRQELVGAYRMGLTDEILPAQGIDGLYTSTLFEYSPRVLQQLGPALELGRSYVRKEYQRKPLPLLLLWRGIAEFIGRHPRYVVVFGPVSISDEYLTMSKKLMMAFLQTHRALTQFAQLVRPRNPPRFGALHEFDADHARSAIRDLDEVDQVVRELENGERAVPVLLRQYLRMNARLLAFNVDHDFGNVVDALMYADMREIHPRIQDFYLGREKAAAFRRVHGLEEQVGASRSARRGSSAASEPGDPGAPRRGGATPQGADAPPIDGE